MFLFSEFKFDKYIKDTFNLNTGDILSDYQRKKLMDGLGITEFLMDTQCQASTAPYSSTLWSSGRSLYSHNSFKLEKRTHYNLNFAESGI